MQEIQDPEKSLNRAEVLKINVDMPRLMEYSCSHYGIQ